MIHKHDDHSSNTIPIVKELLLRQTTYVPTGVLNMFGGTQPPEGWLMCDGSFVDKNTYQHLYSVIGTNFGTSSNSTQFKLPDMRERFPLGAATANPIGTSGGAATHVLQLNEIPAHSHVINDSHSHTSTVTVSPGSGTTVLAAPSTTTTSTASTGGTSPGPAAAAHNNMPPFITFNYIIKY
jgi:microcystin-dependent protein